MTVGFRAWEIRRLNGAPNRSLLGKTGIFFSSRKIEIWDYDTIDMSVPVCADGILIVGTPGRPSYRKELGMRLGMTNSNIHSSASALIDTRGDLKPELTPARTPMTSSFLDPPPGWKRLADMFSHAQGLLWKQLAEYLQEGLTAETFWRLCVIHGISVKWIPQCTLWDCLPVSLNNKRNETAWRLIRELGEMSFHRKDRDLFVLRDDDENSIGLSPSLYEWEKSGEEHPSLDWQMNSIALLMSGLDIRNGGVLLTPRAPDAKTEAIANYAYSSRAGISMFYVDYTGAAREAIAVETPYPTANRNHPLSRLAIQSKYTSQPTDLQRFASSFINCIAETVSSRNETPSLSAPCYWQKRVGYLFSDVSWNRYAADLQPPYSIWTNDSGWTVIDEECFERWRTAPVRID
jgi:hypothetical protein